MEINTTAIVRLKVSKSVSVIVIALMNTSTGFKEVRAIIIEPNKIEREKFVFLNRSETINTKAARTPNSAYMDLSEIFLFGILTLKIFQHANTLQYIQ